MSPRGEVAVELVTQRHDDRAVHYVSARLPWWVVRIARTEGPWAPSLFGMVDRASLALRAGDVEGARLWCGAAHALAVAFASRAVHEPGHCLCGHVLDRRIDDACRHCRRLAAESGAAWEVGS